MNFTKIIWGLAAGSALIASLAFADGLISAKAQLHRAPKLQFSDRDLDVRSRVVLDRLTTYVRPGIYISAARPLIDNQAYLRASLPSPAIVVDTKADALMVPIGNGSMPIQIFVKGTPSKASVVDCAIDGVGDLQTSVRLGPDAAHLTADPQARNWTTSPSAGHYIFVIPGDVPTSSPTAWFALGIQKPSAAAGTDYLTLYGCKILIET